MSHDKHTESLWNDDLLVDIGGGYVQKLSREKARDHYFRLVEGMQSKYPDPVVRTHGGIRVVRDDLLVGTKARAGEAFVWGKPEARHLVYCQPRTGLAGVSILDVAKKYDREVTLFMPACKEISRHQSCCVERGANVRFERIAAMPNLNKYAREWAEEHGHAFVPLGLRHPLATAGIVRAASLIPEPEVVFVAVSTGVLMRALQIAWPNSKFVGVCVARNLQEGERGDADLISYPGPFQRPAPESDWPPFPSVPTYDAKAWSYAKYYKMNFPKQDVLFWNVGTDPQLLDPTIPRRIYSNVDWRKKPNLLEIE